MKKIITTLIFCFGVLYMQAQSATQSFTVNGIKVIFKPTAKNVVNVRVYFRGGVTNYPANRAGIEHMALNAATKCGTQKYGVAAFKDTLDKYGIFLFGISDYDYGYIQLNCISKYFNQGWDVFSDAVMNPVFDTEEYKLITEKQIAANKDAEADPKYSLYQLQMQNAFSQTPYTVNPHGTDETLTSLTTDDVKNYYNTLLNKSRMFIVVVGNITKQELFEKILSAFGSIPARSYTLPDLQAPVLNDNKLLIAKSALATNYVGAVLNAPDFTSTNYVPYSLGVSALGGNLFQTLRSQLKLSYAPRASFYSMKMPFTTMYAGSNDVQAVMQGMLKALREIQQIGVNDEWLQHIKYSFITNSFINDQSASAITNSLGLAEILGNWQYADQFAKLVQLTTAQQVNSALNSYIIGVRWTVLGNPESIGGIKPPVY